MIKMTKTRIKKEIKLGFFALFIVSISAVSAQTTDPTDAGLENGAGAGETVRVIDNKGTIKYFQSNNGITTITSTTAGSATTTTWQLGGTLTDNTYIDVDGNAFALDGIELVDTSTLAASTDATTESDHGTGTGFTLLVRDEVTGATKKLLASDLIQSGAQSISATLGQTAFSLTGSPILPAFSQVWVYRNGAKLRSNVDYTVATSVVTLVPGGTAPNDWAVYAGDIIEIQYIK